MAEAQGLHVEVDDGRVGGRLEVVGVELGSGGEASGTQDLADVLLVVDRRDEQQPPRRLGEVGDARGERPHQAIGERQRTGRERPLDRR